MTSIRICKKCGNKFEGIRCKLCQQKYQKQWYQNNRQKVLQQSNDYYYNNIEKIKVRQKKYNRKWYYENRECVIQRVKDCNNSFSENYRHNILLNNNYGITRNDYDEILERQKGVCAICGSNTSGSERYKNFCVDHNHVTGEIRGLLCQKCNIGLGNFKDSIELLEEAIKYLKNPIVSRNNTGVNCGLKEAMK